ncbi:MAG TPA: amidohydrolase family protein [Candidatus Binatia bacterium]|nr:amidohydrolase family protein [Candidatus Binatia bacterium]
MSPQRIDVHQHVVPPAYADWLRSNGLREAGGRELPQWSVEDALRVMDDHQIATGILSISTPGVHLELSQRGDTEARAKARELNEFAAQVARDAPRRFGFFATLTLPDVAGALVEAEYALDTLRAAGVILLANTHGRYLGAPEDEPLFAELNRRRAVVFIHPSTLPGPRIDGIPPFAADFLLDTTRAAYRLVQSGVVRRYPDLKIILAHAGGFVPYASHRLAAAIAAETRRSPLDVIDDLANFYFDTALSGSPAALPSLLAFAKPGHVLFGSDWPYAPAIAVSYFTGQLDAYAALDGQGHAAIDRRNAESLFPQFAGMIG